MIGRLLPAGTGEDAVRVVRALGAHRYVRGSLHVVHALAIDAIAHGRPPEDLDPRFAAAAAWAEKVLTDPAVDAGSRDERLFRTATADELLLVLEGFWVPGTHSDRVHDRLLEQMIARGIDLPDHAPFDEEAEDQVFPLLIDAGWELLSLGELDPERHRGAIQAYDEPILFEAARFEEANAIPPSPLLQELPALGPVELLRGVDAYGGLLEPLVLWTVGDEVYQDYVLRGVVKAAKLG